MEEFDRIINSKNPYKLENFIRQFDRKKQKKLIHQATKVLNKPNDWGIYEFKLGHAFGILLEKPAVDFNTNDSYLLYLNFGDDISNEEYESTMPRKQLTLELLEREQNLQKAGLFDKKDIKELFMNRYKIDFSRSYFTFQKDEVVTKMIPKVILDACIKKKHTFCISGKELAKIIRDKGLNLHNILEYSSSEYRCVVTDGSFFDAMRAATYTMHEDTLLTTEYMAPYDMEDEFENEEKWESALSAVSDTKLKEHLLLMCQTNETSRDVGAFYNECYKLEFLDLNALIGAQLIASWVVGEYWESGIFKFA